MTSKSLQVSLMQSDIHWENKKANLENLESKLADEAQGDLVILPEMYFTGFTMNVQTMAENMDGRLVVSLKSLSAKYRKILVVSVLIEEHDKYYNRLLWIQPDGTIHKYDKRHLFSMSKEPELFAAGRERILTQVNGCKFLPQICYDLRFPVWQRSVDGYDVLIVIASWPQSRMYAWEHLLIARAIENQAYVCAVNRVGEDPYGNVYNGHSMVIAPDGTIVNKALEGDNIINHRLNLDKLEKFRTQFPFLNDRDDFVLMNFHDDHE